MFPFLTLVSLLAVCHGFEISDNFQAWLKDAVPFNVSEPAGSRIVGGNTTTIENHPYTASLQHEWAEYEHDTIHFCTGGIINKNWILTTAQCALLLQLENVTVRVGSSHFHQNGIVYEVQETVLHPLFDLSSDDYNIALLKLNESLVFSNAIQPISLPRANQTIAEGTNFTMASWGAIAYLDDMSTELQEITMPTIGLELCSTVWGDRLTDRMFCAYLESKGICVGDSGTPAVVDGVLIGIASFTYACSAYGYPAVYVDVATLVDWISEISSSPHSATISSYSLLATVIVLVKMRLE